MYKFKKLVLALGLCGAVATGTAAADMKVGALFPFSGALALLGQESYRGLELAVNEINAAGGINGEKIQIVKADAVGRPRPCRNQAPDLIQRDRRVRQLRVRHFYAASPVTELAGVLLRAGRHRPQDHHARLQVPVPQQSQHGAVRRVGESTPCTRPSRRAWG